MLGNVSPGRYSYTKPSGTRVDIDVGPPVDGVYPCRFEYRYGEQLTETEDGDVPIVALAAYLAQTGAHRVEVAA